MEPIEYLVVAAHPDDAEISVGGTLAGLIARGARVGVLDLTDGEPTPHGTIEIRARETSAATAVLGLTWRENLGLPNRRLECNLEARSALASVFRRLRPRVILAHHHRDAHPDHVAASSLTDAARFWAKLSKTDLPGDPWYPPVLLHFFSIHLKAMPVARMVIDVSAHFATKMQALKCYESQLIQGRIPSPSTPLEDMEAMGRAWGVTIRSKYGEPLDSPEELGLSDLSAVR